MRIRSISAAAVLMVVAAPGAAGAQPSSGTSGHFERRVVTTGLADPYEVVSAKDSSLWMTEKTGRRVLRLDPATGKTQTALDLSEVASHSGQDGLLGLALQERRDRVVAAFVSYTYPTADGIALRIVRYATATDGVTLINPRTVMEGLPASNDHQGGRLRLGDDGLLYYSIGDMGAGQLDKICRENAAQRLPTRGEVAARNWVSYQGKTLRMTTTGGIPRSNPAINGVRSHIYTYGHRNQQGLDFGLNDQLYGAEQGPKTDDEVNSLSPGGNYGWPYVAGYRDDKAYEYANWSKAAPTACKDLTYDAFTIPKDVPVKKESDWPGAMVDPMTTAGSTVEGGYNFQDPNCGSQYNLCWPTFAPTSLTAYNQDTIPGWKGSLLVTAQKTGQVYRISTGSQPPAVEKLWTAPERYRDTAISLDGRTIYVATDQAGTVKVGGDGPITSDLQDRGAIIAYTYVAD